MVSSNVDGQSLLNTGAILIVDLRAPISSVQSIQFVDSDPVAGQIGGTVSWISPIAADITNYMIFASKSKYSSMFNCQSLIYS